MNKRTGNEMYAISKTLVQGNFIVRNLSYIYHVVLDTCRSECKVTSKVLQSE